MYLKNLLGVPGGITLAGVPIDLAQVKLPVYFISTVEDHIAPWRTTYRGSRNDGEKVPARTPQNALEDAPGSYVMLRLGSKKSSE